MWLSITKYYHKNPLVSLTDRVDPFWSQCIRLDPFAGKEIRSLLGINSSFVGVKSISAPCSPEPFIGGLRYTCIIVTLTPLPMCFMYPTPKYARVCTANVFSSYEEARIDTFPQDDYKTSWYGLWKPREKYSTLAMLFQLLKIIPQDFFRDRLFFFPELYHIPCI